MAIDNSKIILGLPSLPSDAVTPEMYEQLLTIHKAIKNLLNGVSVYCGVDQVAPSEWADTPASSTILTANLTRMYPIAGAIISAGQLINLYDNAGTINARLADATTAATMAHGIANTGAAVGERIEMQWLRGFTTLVGGMVIGTLYWTGVTPGAIQNLPPVAAGTIQQPVGLAIATNQLLLDIPLSYIQN